MLKRLAGFLRAPAQQIQSTAPHLQPVAASARTLFRATHTALRAPRSESDPSTSFRRICTSAAKMDSSSEAFIVSDRESDFAPSPVAKGKKAAANGKAPVASKGKKAAAAPKKQPLAPRKSNENSDAEYDDVHMEEPAAAPSKAAGKTKTATETYQKLTQLEHILKRPDTYIGSVERQKDELWVFDKTAQTMAYRKIEYVPGFYKIFDEILVNAADNKVRDPTMTWIKVKIDREEGSISVENNGKGIPIEKHEKEKVYIPELIFGHLLTSSNYDDDEDKVTGGRNGYGAKLANIYSTEFVVETGNKDIEKKYTQTFSDNMSKIGKPSIVKGKTDFTKITFKPDFKRFGMEGINDDIEALMMKRVYDMAGTVKDCNVWLNGEKIKISSFKAYVEMYVKAIRELNGDADVSETGIVPGQPSKDDKPTIIYESSTDKGKTWEVAFAVSDGTARQVSFVNNIATVKGGRHVDLVEHQITSKILAHLDKGKKASGVKLAQIKNYCWVFINCQIVNPTFDGQTKETLTLKPSAFGSKWQMSETFEKKVLKSGVLDHVVSFARFQQEKQLKKTDGAKRKRITGIPKLEDANNAGSGRKSRDCTLILTEGDSAKALAVSGLTEVGRDNYGVFPLRGKLLNVREANHDQIMKNSEISNIKEILGLRHGVKYENVDSLRYGSLMIMTDQDHDGSHIKGLIINFFDTFFPSLLQIPDFLVEFITPIVKATKGKQELAFFTIPEYETWKNANNNGAGWKIKYYKGLGTSESADMKRYFRAMNKHMLPFEPTSDGDRELIDLAFNKKKADDRKEWLRQFKPGTFLDHNISKVPVADFINKELILFSMADNMRSIPSMVDGLKPGQRKIMFACFKKKLTPKQEMKVAQLGGYVSEHTAYHHGENNLAMTIVGLAQQFTGSNNLNLLAPLGQFGTRALGGKDAAAARYIFTTVPEHTRALFHPADDALLNYLNEEGQSIEPEWYMPTVPLVLINGSDGIGTGWSSQVPNYNLKDVIANLRRRMKNEEYVKMHPWYRGFTGKIEQDTPDRYKISGTARLVNEDDPKVWEITELPVQTWTTPYKEFLEAKVSGTDKAPATIKDYKEYHSDRTVHFIIELNDRGVEEIKKEGAEKWFRLTTTKATSNMVLFDSDGKIKKYASAEEILEDFYLLRMSHYQKRKDFLVEALKDAYDRLSNQARFIKMIIDKELVVSNRKRADIVADLRKKNFRAFPKQIGAVAAADIERNPDDEEEMTVSADNDYDYLLNMAIYTLTREKVEKLLAQRDAKEKELNTLLGRTPASLWEEDLAAIEAQWDKMLEEDERLIKEGAKTASKKGKAPVKRAPKAAAAARKVLKDDEDVEMDDSEDDFKPKASSSKKPAKPKAASAVKRSASVLDDDALDLLAGAGVGAGAGPSKSAASKGSKLLAQLDEVDTYLQKPSTSKAGASGAGARKLSIKKAKVAASDDDDSIVMTGPVVPRAKSGRAASGKVQYIESDEDDGE